MPDKTKIFAADSFIYIASRGATPDTAVAHDVFPGTTWKNIGYFKRGTAKVSTEVHEIDLNDGQKQQLGVTMKFEAAALESDATMMTTLEGMINNKCDIIIKPVSSSITRVVKLLGFNVSVGLEGPFVGNEPLTVPVKGQSVGSKVTDVYDDITLS
jgi:hypothetical protein